MTSKREKGSIRGIDTPAEGPSRPTWPRRPVGPSVGHVWSITLRSDTGSRGRPPSVRGRTRGQTFIAALRHDRLDAPWVIGGAMNREFFDLHVETQLAPTLYKGDVVMLDNLATHRSPKAAAILKDIGAWFVFRGKPSTGRLCDPSNSCRHTLPTSTQSRWHSPRSRP